VERLQAAPLDWRRLPPRETGGARHRECEANANERMLARLRGPRPSRGREERPTIRTPLWSIPDRTIPIGGIRSDPVPTPTPAPGSPGDRSTRR